MAHVRAGYPDLARSLVSSWIPAPSAAVVAAVNAALVLLIDHDLAVSTFAFWGTVLGWVSYRWPGAERWIEGTPRILVRDGQLIEANMKRDRLTRRELESEMRLAGIGRLDDVAWAILEPEGKISFIRRDDGDVVQNDDAPV